MGGILQFKGIDAAYTETVEKKGARVERRKHELLSAKELPEIPGWTECQCVGRVTRKRSKSDKTTEEIVYYITSLDFDVEQFGRSVRDHWGVENSLHWALDVIFQEDGIDIRNG